MSERDTTAKKFFEIVGVNSDDRIYEIYFAAGDYALSSMVAGTLSDKGLPPDHAQQFAIYCDQLAAQHNFNPEEMDQVIRECQDAVAERYGLKTGRAQ